jgi:hypothetical protein
MSWGSGLHAVLRGGDVLATQQSLPLLPDSPVLAFDLAANSMHMTPLRGIFRMNPDFSHIDIEDEPAEGVCQPWK